MDTKIALLKIFSNHESRSCAGPVGTAEKEYVDDTLGLNFVRPTCLFLKMRNSFPQMQVLIPVPPYRAYPGGKGGGGCPDGNSNISNLLNLGRARPGDKCIYVLLATAGPFPLEKKNPRSVQPLNESCWDWNLIGIGKSFLDTWLLQGKCLIALYTPVQVAILMMQSLTSPCQRRTHIPTP